jgi:hypothetical protein
MANNPNNIKLSACRVRWGGRDLGLTKGGVDVTIKTSSKPINVDQFGTSDVNEYVTGRTINVKCPFAETDLDTFYALLKQTGATLNDTGVSATNTLTIATQPIAADTITVNGHVFTFVAAVASPFVPDTILIGGSIAVTAQNIVAVLQQSTDPNVLAGIYVATATTVVVTYYRSGVAGNAFTLASSGTHITITGSTLTGGTDATYRNVSLSTGTGTSMLATALPLVLHPSNKADGDTTEDWVIPLANLPGNLSFAYKFDNERVYMVEFNGYPNLSTNVLAVYGNSVPLL